MSERVVAFGFATLGVVRIVGGHFVDNPGSGRVLTKLGFRYSGRTSRAFRARGHEVESLEMAFDRADWPLKDWIGS